MKTLSPQAPSPLGSPFLWPGVEGPGSPGSPKQGAPHATPHTGTASHFSLEHPMVSRDPPSASRDRCYGCSVGGWHTGSGQQADPRAPPESSDPPASMWRGKQALACPQRWLPTLAAWGRPSKPLAHLRAHLSRCLQLGWDFPSWLLGSRSFSVSYLFLSYPCPDFAKLPSSLTLNLPEAISQSFFLIFSFFPLLSLWAPVFHLLSLRPPPTPVSCPPSPLPPLSLSVVTVTCVRACVYIPVTSSFSLSLLNPCHDTSHHCSSDPHSPDSGSPYGLVLPRTDSCLTPYPC